MFIPPVYLVSRFLHTETLVTLGRDWCKSDGWHTRFKVYTKNGPVIIPVSLSSRHGVAINDTELYRPARFFLKLEKTLRQSYGRSPYFDAVWSIVLEAQGAPTLGLFSHVFLGGVFSYLGRGPNIIPEESLGLVRSEDASTWLATIGAAIGGTHYLCAKDAPDKYLSVLPFTARGIMVVGQDYSMPPCTGLSDACMSILDLLFRASPAEANLILEGT